MEAFQRTRLSLHCYEGKANEDRTEERCDALLPFEQLSGLFEDVRLEPEEANAGRQREWRCCYQSRFL